MKSSIARTLAVLPAVTLFAALPASYASETSARISSTANEAKGDAAKAALKELDAQIDALDDTVDNAPTAADKDAAKRRVDALKDRRNDLRKTYVQARYDELKDDIRAETNRIGSWSKHDYKREPVAVHDRTTRDARHDVDRATDHASAVAASTAAGIDLAAYKLRPTDTDKNEAKAALTALDHRIDELEKHADNMPKGADRDIAKRRAKAFEDRKDELKSDFSKERFNALVDEVEADLKQFR